MPLLSPSTFDQAWYMRGGHLETIVPSVYRKIPVPYVRERIATPDDDFLDLDWLTQGSRRLMVLTHGLEGSSDRHYVAGTAHRMFAEGWDVLAWNCRSCSGEMNRQFRLYHHGETDDIHQVITHAMDLHAYDTVVLAGYSMGGSISLRYLADYADRLPAAIRAGIAVSTPVDLGDSARELEKPRNAFYRNRFIRKLRKKLLIKAQQWPDRVDVDRLRQVKTFEDFDEHFSAPMFGLSGAEAFYAHASVVSRLPNLTRPGLLLVAENDPMLGAACYPRDLARTSDFLHMEVCQRGGHTGFWRPGQLYTYADERIVSWLQTVLGEEAKGL